MKKIISFFLLCILIPCMMIPISALDSNSNFIDGDNDLPSPDAIDLSKMDNNIMLLDQFPSSFTISVPVCKQETSYYCGPATVQQVLKFNNGVSDTTTQAAIAKAIGTTTSGSTLSPMLPYIREHTTYGFVGYQIYKNPSIEQMRYLIAKTVYFDYGPPIARIVFKKTGNWPYSTNGHYLNVSGYDYKNESNLSASNNRVRLTDPNIQRVNPSSDGSYWVTLSEIHTATATANSKEFAAG